MLTLKETFDFLSKNPSLQDISRILNINRDTLIYLDLLYKELQLKKSKINQFIKKIAKNERNTLEKAFIEIYTGTKHKESSFLERLYLSKKYGSVFTDYLKKYKRYKNINERLLNIYYVKEVKSKEKVYKMIKKSPNFIEIIPFFQGIISEEKYFKFLKGKNLEVFCELINQIKGEPFYKILSKKISKLSIEKTIILVNNITFLDNLTLYKHLLQIYYQKNKPFKKFQEYFKIIWIDDQNKLKILFCWLRIFIIRKQFKRFISLYKYLEGIQEKEMILYKVFYNCIKEYKISNKLRFSKFNKLCKSVKDDNPFKCVGLRELGENFNFEE